MKKIGALIAAFLIFIGVSNAFAQESAVFDVAGLGIMPVEQMSEMALEEPLTRGEMAEIFASLLGMPNPPSGLVSGFQDVMPEDNYYPAIAYLEAIGLLGGDGNGMFRPADIAECTEAVKLTVSCLGYDAVAIEAGGYPAGYLGTASSLGILKGITGVREITRRDMVRLLSNALDCKLLESITFGEEKKYQIAPNKTLRSILSVQGNREIIKSRGIVRATTSLYLDQPIPSIRYDQVEIDGQLYDVGKTDAARFFGMEIEFYAAYDSNTDRYTLITVRETNRNRVTEISAEDFSDAADGVLRYWNASDTKSVKYNAGARVVYNGRPLFSYTDADIQVENGFLRLIDNDGDQVADVICITDYHSGVIERVSSGIVYFERGEDAGGVQSVAVNMDDPDVEYLLHDSEGNLLTVEELSPGNVLSVAAARDGSRYELIISNATAEGSINAQSEEKGIQIEQNWYRMEQGKSAKVSAGDDVIAYLNHEGQIVKIAGRGSNKRYGYIMAVADNGFGTVKVKMIEAGKLKAEEETDDSDPDNPITVRILRAGNASISEYALASRVNIDKISYTAENAAKILLSSAPVEFELNKDGMLRQMTHPIKSGVGEEKYYNSYEKTFGQLGGSVFATNDDTSVICLPSNGATANRDLLAKIDMDENNQKYTISGYNVDEQTGYAELVVLTAALNADAVGVINRNSKIGVAEQAVKVIDEEGDERIRVDFWTDGKRMSYYVSDILPQNKTQELCSGTVFFYELTNAEEIGEISVLHQLDTDTPWYSSGNAELTLDLYGGAERMEFYALSYEKNRFVHRLMVNTVLDVNAAAVVDINVRNTPDMYLYKKRSQTVSVIESGEILDGGGKRQIYAHIVNGDTKIIVAVE